MAKLTLFNIVDEYKELYELSIDPDVDPQVVADSIESIIGCLEVKATGYVQVIKQLDMEAKQADEVAKAFAAKAEVRKNNVKRMKEALKMAMEQTDQESIAAGAFTIKLQKNGGVEPLIIDKPEAVPENMTKITIEADKDKIRAFLEKQDGKACEYAHIGERGKHVVIK